MVHCVVCCREVNKCCTSIHTSLVADGLSQVQELAAARLPGSKAGLLLVMCRSTDGAILFRMRRCV